MGACTRSTLLVYAPFSRRGAFREERFGIHFGMRVSLRVLGLVSGTGSPVSDFVSRQRFRVFLFRFGVRGSFRDQSLRWRVQPPPLPRCLPSLHPGSRFRGYGLGCIVQGAGCRVSCVGEEFRVWGVAFGVKPPPPVSPLSNPDPNPAFWPTKLTIQTFCCYQ